MASTSGTSGTSDQTARVDAADPSHPQFIIASNGKYYLTTGVWEFDPNKTNLSDTQKLGVEAVSDHFARLRKEGWERVAVQTTESAAAYRAFQHTFGPPPPPPGGG